MKMAGEGSTWAWVEDTDGALGFHSCFPDQPAAVQLKL